VNLGPAIDPTHYVEQPPELDFKLLMQKFLEMKRATSKADAKDSVTLEDVALAHYAQFVVEHIEDRGKAPLSRHTRLLMCEALQLMFMMGITELVESKKQSTP